jgi:hypothetical protein
VSAIVLTKQDTEMWEQSQNDAWRRYIRAIALERSRDDGGATVEIHSHDGIVLDALNAEPIDAAREEAAS